MHLIVNPIVALFCLYIRVDRLYYCKLRTLDYIILDQTRSDYIRLDQVDRWMDGWMDRYIDRQKDRQTDRQGGRQADRQRNREKNREKER